MRYVLFGAVATMMALSSSAVAQDSVIINLDTGENIDALEFALTNREEFHGPVFRFENVLVGSAHVVGAWFKVEANGRNADSVSVPMPKTDETEAVRRYLFLNCPAWEDKPECRLTVEGRFEGQALFDAEFSGLAP